jgi:hypothetical protein
MNLHSQCLGVVCAIRLLCQVSKIQLNVVPPIIKLQWHCAYIWLHSSNRLEQEYKLV